MNPNLIALAFKIADSAARSDIECHCQIARTDGALGEPGYRNWYDTADVDDICPRADIDQAVRYLDQRGHIIRDPEQPRFVTFPPIAALQDAAA